MAKKPQTFDGKDFSFWQVLDSANAYYEFSTFYTSRLTATLDDLGERPDLAVASATNRILALELYLKALLMGVAVPVPKEHDLKVLFDALPEQNRLEVRMNFDERCQLQPQLGVPWDLCLYFGLGPVPLDDKALQKGERRRVRSDATIDGLLIRNRNGFIASRYLFQEARHGQVNSFTYEHRRLAVLCSVICEGLENGMPERPANYVRHFVF